MFTEVVSSFMFITVNVQVYSCVGGKSTGVLTLTELYVPDTEDASETDLAKHDEDDYVELKEQ